MADDHFDERLKPLPPGREGLYHVQLPGFKRDPLWVYYMETASQTAVGIMQRGTGNKDIILKNERNLSTMINRAAKLAGTDQEKVLQTVQAQLSNFISHPTIRDIADYVFADAHNKYHLYDSQFQPVTSMYGVAQTICNYGTPRELAPAFDTPFSGEYRENPYGGYVQRARHCKENYSDVEGYMRAPLAKLVSVPGKGYAFTSVSGQEELRLTNTSDFSWWPTSEVYFDPVWEHIERLFADLSGLVSSDQSNIMIEEKTLLISQIGWWYFQLMPYTRGSGAIGVALLQSLFDYSGIRNSPYKDGISPDLEALVTPLPQYAENFQGFYTKEFTPADSRT